MPAKRFKSDFQMQNFATFRAFNIKSKFCEPNGIIHAFLSVLGRAVGASACIRMYVMHALRMTQRQNHEEFIANHSEIMVFWLPKHTRWISNEIA